MFSVCDYSNFYIFFKETITFRETAAVSESNNVIDEKVMFENCAPLNNCISRIKTTQEDDVRDIDVVIPMHNLIQYSDNYSKTSGILWQYSRDEPVVDGNSAIFDFTVAKSITYSLKIKDKITGETGNDGTKKLK